MGGLSSSFLPLLFYGATFIVASIIVMHGSITIGQLTAAIGYSSRIHALLHTLLTTFMKKKRSTAEINIINQYLQLPDEFNDSGSLKWKFESCIRFDDVSFSYSNSKTVFKNLSLVFPKGKWIGLQGVSGVGKTTILELILRFYECQDGSIYVDDINIRDINLYDLRRNIGYVAQESFLLEGSIVDNLRLANSNASMQQIHSALKMVELDYLFDDARMFSRIGEGGLNLSGGERQRITIAQCLIKGASVILLDEVTSQLDEMNQVNIQNIFKSLRNRGITIISVSHQKGFNEGADIIYDL